MTPAEKTCLFFLMAATTALADIAPATTNGEREITLEQAIAFSMKQNRDLAVIALSVDSRSVAIERAKSEFMLNLKPQAQTQVAGNSGSSSYGVALTGKNSYGTEASVGGRVSKDTFLGTPDLYRKAVVVEVQQPLLRRFGRLPNEEQLNTANSAFKAANREVEIKKIAANARATVEIEGLKPSKESEEISKRCLRGEISNREAKKQILKLHGIER